MRHCPQCHADGMNEMHIKHCEVKIYHRCLTCDPLHGVDLSDLGLRRAGVGMGASAAAAGQAAAGAGQGASAAAAAGYAVAAGQGAGAVAAAAPAPLYADGIPDGATPFRALERQDGRAALILEEFRAMFQTARVLIPVSMALGHKGSSVLVAKRLIELRAVSMVVIKPERIDVQRDSTKLLSTIHPRLTWGKSVVVDGETIVVAEPADNKKPLVKPLGNVIGFTGGFESDLSRLRDALDVEDAIILQPPAWGKGTCALSVATKPPWRLRVALERSAFYVSPAGAPGVVLERLYPDCPSVDMSMFEPGVLLCPVYGLHHGSVRADLALPCIVRALAALCDRLGRHGVVLALGAEALHALPLPPAADAMHGYARRDVKRWLGDKQNKGRVLVAYSGVLPPDVFQTVVAHCNLPYFFEGAGTLSTAFNLGKPYIRLLGNDRDKNYYPELAGHERDVSRLDTLGTDVARQGDRHTTFEALSAYFMYCTVRPRDASAYFAALRKKYHRAAMDKVFLAVAAWVLGARKTGEALANLALDDWSGK